MSSKYRTEKAMSTEPTVLEASPIEITKAILVDLQKLSLSSGEPIAAVYADSLLRVMHDLHDFYPSDPYTEVIMALHDALFFQNRWIDYTKTQLSGACDLISSLVSRVEITSVDVEDSILALENLGFDTLPFGVNFAEIQDENGEEE
jgi:hypothetical protein